MSTFNCAQSELFSSGQVIFGSTTEHLALLTAFKPKYTAPWVTAALAALDVAEALPDDAARAALHRILRINLEGYADEGRSQFQSLKRYIEDAFPRPEWPVRFSEAGQGYYDKASGNDWEANKSLMTSGRSFITAHTVQLSAGNNMPPAFPAAFNTAANNVRNTHLLFIAAQESARVGAQTKQQACETQYDIIIQVCKDGVQAADGDTAIQSQFTFASVLELIRGSGIAGIRGFVTDLITADPVFDVLVEIIGTDHSDRTNAEGRYTISPVAAGSYTIRFSHPDYQALEVPFEISTGTISSLSVQLARIIP